MKIKFVGQAMIHITVYHTNLLTLLCFTYKMMMIFYTYYKLYKTTASLPDFSRRTLKSSPLFWMFSTLSSSSLLSIKGEMWRLVLWKPNSVRRPLHHIRLIICQPRSGHQPLGQVSNLVNHTDQVTRPNGALMVMWATIFFWVLTIKWFW